MRFPEAISTSSHKHNKGSEVRNKASTMSTISSMGFFSRSSMRSRWHCTRSRKAATRMAQVRTMPSACSRAASTSSTGPIWLKSGMGGWSAFRFLLPLGFEGEGEASAFPLFFPGSAALETSRPMAFRLVLLCATGPSDCEPASPLPSSCSPAGERFSGASHTLSP